MFSLHGQWKVRKKDNSAAYITLPGSLDGSGLGDKITTETEWYSGLHNPFWYEREEYKAAGDTDSSCADGAEGASECLVPFLSQSLTRYIGKADYERTFVIPEDGDYFFFLEVSKWRISVRIDDADLGSEESLVAPFVFGPVPLSAGEHSICVTVDNSLIYPYRPDSHGISDALGAGWNGMGGRIEILSSAEYAGILEERKKYAAEHPVSVSVSGNCIMVNGKAVYIRATHFGGGFPETLLPDVSKEYWDRVMDTVLEWGFNTIRFHSFCPPEQAFLSADEKGVFLQPECGMWNVFNPGEDEMPAILLKETKKILENFGHHPSFILLSSTNEPAGNWYEPLRKWVADAKKLNEELGFSGRRLFTAQSGWFYDVPPKDITGTDYIFFHRSACGPVRGGMIRNRHGWQGGDYSVSLEGSKLPVITHEMGQWCAYPDLDITKKFTGPVRGGNYEVFRRQAERKGVLGLNKDFVFCSGRAQVRFLKEEFEANFRTPELTGFEYLDLHDYTGQGTAVVGVLDPFFDNKGYVTPEEFRLFNSDIVILTRIEDYVQKSGSTVHIPVEVCNFSGEELKNAKLRFEIKGVFEAELNVDAATGKNTKAGGICVKLDVPSGKYVLEAELYSETGELKSQNNWTFTVFEKKNVTGACFENYCQAGEVCAEARTEVSGAERAEADISGKVVITHSTSEAEEALKAGKTVFFNPYLSDLDFDCPATSQKYVFWNAQMGPSWSRLLGTVIDEKSPLFKHFPTERAGGWEWEDILNNARALNFPAKYTSIVRVIDDWNRNFPLSLIFEGKVFNGKLLMCTADLSGGFEERPAAYTLRNAILEYISSKDFEPEQTIEWAHIKEHLRPLFAGCDIIKSITINGTEPERAINLKDINPNMPFRYRPESFPADVEIELAKPVKVKRLYVLPIQSDRDFPGVIKDYSVIANGKTVSGTWLNAFETQWSEPVETVTDRLTLRVSSTYGMGEATRWFEEKNGFIRRRAVEPLQLTAAALGIEYEDDGVKIRHSNSPFWREEAAKRHTEIEN